jgi:hypothetical protein
MAAAMPILRSTTSAGVSVSRRYLIAVFEAPQKAATKSSDRWMISRLLRMGLMVDSFA